MSSSGTDEPTQKKSKTLRSAEPDLLVVVKYSAPKEDEEGTEQMLVEKEYHMFSQILASQSNFVDTALSVEMNERETRTIKFQCASPEIFEKALQFLEDPPAAKRATVDDVLQIIAFYHMYEFAGGLSFADDKMAEYILEQSKCFIDKVNYRLISEVIDKLVDLIVLANSLDLKLSQKAGIDFINMIFERFEEWFGATFFSEQAVRKLQPFLHQNYESIKMPAGVEVASEEEVESILFPKYFCKSAQYFCISALVGKPTSIYLHDTDNEEINGEYFLTKSKDRWETPIVNNRDDTHNFQKHAARGPRVASICEWTFQVFLARMTKMQMDRFIVSSDYYDDVNYENEGDRTGDWAILADPTDEIGDRCLWWSPKSSHLPFPPKGPWVVVEHYLVESANPQVSYKFANTPMTTNVSDAE